MLNFPQAPKSYQPVSLADTDKPLPDKLNPNTRYAYFSTIAKGGKSLIKSCKDMHLSRFVCYKTLKPEFAKDKIEQTRLIREARVTAMLQHPNTVPTYELGRDSRGNPYFTMKLVHGYTLREILDYRERYDLIQLMDVVMQVGHALQYAHTHGVAHRDIKPENILVGPYSEVLLLDWGLAKVWDIDKASLSSDDLVAETSAGAAINASEEVNSTITSHEKPQGTISYMSPEQLRSDPAINYHTDIYSLGAIIYEVLCGRTPFISDKVYELTDSIMNETPAAPSDLSTQRVPKLLETICMTCLNKAPSERYRSMAELLRELKQDWRSELGWMPGGTNS